MRKNWKSLKLVQMGRWLKLNKMELLSQSTTPTSEIPSRKVYKHQLMTLTGSLEHLMKAEEWLTERPQPKLQLLIKELHSEKRRIEIELLNGTAKLGGKSSL